MELILYNMLAFIVEFLKIYFGCKLFLNVMIVHKKELFAGVCMATVIIGGISVFFNVSEYGILFGVISIALLCMAMGKIDKIGILSLIFICICFVDMLMASAYMVIFDSDMEQLRNVWITLEIDSVLLCILMILFLLKWRWGKREASTSKLPVTYFIAFIIGGIALGYYLTSIQFWAFGEEKNVVKEINAFALGIAAIIFVVICFALIINNNYKENFKTKALLNGRLLEMQRAYYMMLLRKDEETKKFRHDISNHLYCMYTLLKNKEFEKLEEYFRELDISLKELKPDVDTGNKLIDAILHDLLQKHKNVKMIWKGKFPNEISISLMDMCTIFSNLLRNAFEAAELSEKKEIIFSVKILETTLLIREENSVLYEPKHVNGSFLSRKKEKGHGYGMANMKECIEKNQGTFEAYYENGKFIVQIVFMNIILG